MWQRPIFKKCDYRNAFLAQRENSISYISGTAWICTCKHSGGKIAGNNVRMVTNYPVAAPWHFD